MGCRRCDLAGVMGCLCESWLEALGINLSSFSDLDSLLAFYFSFTPPPFALRRISACLDLCRLMWVGCAVRLMCCF